MSCYGANFTVNGVNAGLALRGPGNGRYQVVFERELASLEQVEAINRVIAEVTVMGHPTVGLIPITILG